jgi:hypothetical protein
MENLKLETEIQRELSCMCLRSVGSIDVTVPANSHKNQVQEFFLLMAICNTVVVSLHPHEDIVSNFFIQYYNYLLKWLKMMQAFVFT